MQFTLSADGSTAWETQHAGEVFLQAVGTFGGGTLTAQIRLADGSTVQAVEDGSFTAGPVSQYLTVPREMPVRFTLSGATTPSIVGEIRGFS